MKKYIYEGKNIEELKEQAKNELNLSEDNLIINVLEEKNSLLKKYVKIEVVSINDMIKYIKEFLSEILKLMNIDFNFEIRRRENQIIIKIFSNKNSVLIGKNGKNLLALQTIVRQVALKNIITDIKIILDVENYKEKKDKYLEYFAKKTAREVASTKVEVKLDSMNSYDRRIIHNALSDNKFVYTESVGEEPNRCIVIKPKEEN